MSFSYDIKKPSVLYENRYCNQDEFDIVICGGRKRNNCATSKVKKLKGPEFQASIKLTPMLNERKSSKTAVVGSDIYVFGGYDRFDIWLSSFELYSAERKCLTDLLPELNGIKHYSVCSFMKSIYVVGGFYGRDEDDDRDYVKNLFLSCKRDCYKYNTKDNKWYRVAYLQTERGNSACTVFEGKIVATGGEKLYGGTSDYNRYEALKSVESYDHHENKWTFLSNLITERYNHSSLSMGNKMFVIARANFENSEVYDSVSRKFTMIASKKYNLGYDDKQAFSVKDDIFILDSEVNLWVYSIY